MSGVRSMLARVQRLEQARVAPRSPFEAAYGSLDVFAADTQTEIDAGNLCSVDMPIILNCIRRWHSEGVWGAWQRDKVWEYGR